MKTLSVINPNAAGIDVGSEKLFVSIAGDEPVVFGTVTEEVYRMRDFLKQNGVTTVAMEATGVYWLYAYAVLDCCAAGWFRRRKFGACRITSDCAPIISVRRPARCRRCSKPWSG